jgi:2-methylisocitrate lyase-like PEP mutase family enzyme
VTTPTTSPTAAVPGSPGAAERARAFLALHRGDRPLLLPNPWDTGSARLLAWLGFQALATTSSGFAATLGQLDGTVSREEALAHAAAMVAATNLPVSADLEHGFGDGPDAVAETVSGALACGLAGCSIEDSTGRADAPIYDQALAVDRVAAAAETAHAGHVHLVLTARAENHLHGVTDLDDTIARLQSYQEAGADVLYAPGLTASDDIVRLLANVDRPVNVLARPGAPTVAELGQLGVSRISVGGAFAFAAIDAVVSAGRQLLDDGTYGFLDHAAPGAAAARAAFAVPLQIRPVAAHPAGGT